MKILKSGSSKKKAHFTCTSCGCEFECEESEYWVDNSVCLTSWPCQYYAMASCPICHKICKTTVTSEVNNITITGTSADTNVINPLEKSIFDDFTYEGPTPKVTL